MLVLTREVGQSVTLNIPGYPYPVELVLLSISLTNRVRLGFDAPRDVLITRDNADHEEIMRYIKNNREAKI